MEVDLLVFVALVAFLAVIAATLFGLASYSGFSYVPEVVTGLPPLAQCRIAYKLLKGSYGGSVVGTTFTEVSSIAPNATILGIFYDNPQEVEESRLRCAVGCVVSGEGQDPLPQEALDLLAKNEFKFMELPEIGSSVNTSFPHRTPLSIRLAPIRVYPALTQFIEEKGLCAYPMVEVYKESEIRYMAPLSKQDLFFVPEALQEESEPELVESAEEEESEGSEAVTQSEHSGTESDFEQIELPKAKA